jgi:tetratricopeptide (TPR) repeat protein
VSRELPAGAKLAGYRIERVLGQGGMGVVYEALQLSLRRTVALKVLTGAAPGTPGRERFRREAELQAALDHPHIVAVFEAGEADQGLYIAMQLVRGGTLRDAIGDGLEPARAVALLAPVAEALDVAHEAGLVHRDVKPQNILLDLRGRALLADFGLVRTATSASLTATGGFMGTPDYVAPEQARGEQPTSRSDVYSLAAVLYECLTGSVVFPSDNAQAAVYAHISEPPVAASARRAGLPEAVDAALAAGLAKDPAERPATAGELIDELRRALEDGPPTTAATAASGPTRRLVTVLCAQLEPGEDPEVWHATLARWTQQAGEIAERHGGTVRPGGGEDFVAMFGLDRLHEDDALRALRAAEELTGKTVRIGIDSGLVFVDRTVIGAALRSAVSLAQSAPPGEIRLGAGAQELLAGRGGPEAPPRTPFVGRERELSAVRAVVAAARDQRACRLVTVLGPAGIGKSRLARELVKGLEDDMTVLVGRCPPYGEGLTYRPLAEMLEQIPRDSSSTTGSDELRILAALGRQTAPTRPEETAWSARRLLERLAAEQPVLAIFEDVHWAQPVLLDLIDHVATFSGGSPLAIVCLARPDLLETRAGWATPQPNRSLLVLEPLAPEDAQRLATAGGADDERAATIVEAAEGNPLFLEQLLTVESGTLPPTVQAVLAARIDALAPAEREIVEVGSVFGRSFAVGALGPGPAPVADLHSLVRKQLLTPDRAHSSGDDQFRFRHALIRDAAYEGISHRRRAALHEQAAEWIEQREREPDRSALAGLHLEQAYRHRSELGDDDRELAQRAAAHLEVAAEAALDRGDLGSGIGLLERALDLSGRESREAAALMPGLGEALLEAGRLADAGRVLAEAVELARDLGEPGLEARALVEQQFLRIHADVGGDLAPVRRTADAALHIAETRGDVLGACRALRLRAETLWTESRAAAASEVWHEAARLADQVGAARQRIEILGWLASAAAFGPQPVPEAIAFCRGILEEVRDRPLAEADVRRTLALLHAYEGDFAQARELIAQANAVVAQFGHMHSAVSHHEADVELVAGAPDRAERRLRADYDVLAGMGEQAYFATTAALLAGAVQVQGRDEEADALCEESRRAAADGDLATQALWRSVRARVLAGRGRTAEAEALAREAVAIVDRTDALTEQGDALVALAEILESAGRRDEAEKALHEAAELYDRKGATVLAERVRGRLSTSTS